MVPRWGDLDSDGNTAGSWSSGEEYAQEGPEPTAEGGSESKQDGLAREETPKETATVQAELQAAGSSEEREEQADRVRKAQVGSGESQHDLAEPSELPADGSPTPERDVTVIQATENWQPDMGDLPSHLAAGNAGAGEAEANQPGASEARSRKSSVTAETKAEFQRWMTSNAPIAVSVTKARSRVGR